MRTFLTSPEGPALAETETGARLTRRDALNGAIAREGRWRGGRRGLRGAGGGRREAVKALMIGSRAGTRWALL